MSRLFVLIIAALSAGCAAPPTPIRRGYASPAAPYAESVSIPPKYGVVRLSGVLPDPIPTSSAPQDIDYGDTETQTASVLSKIAAILDELEGPNGMWSQ